MESQLKATAPAGLAPLIAGQPVLQEHFHVGLGVPEQVLEDDAALPRRGLQPLVRDFRRTADGAQAKLRLRMWTPHCKP